MLKVITIDFWNTIFDSSGGTERNKYRQKAFIEEIDKQSRLVKQDELTQVITASWEFFNHIWKNEMRTPGTEEMVDFFWKKLQLRDNQQSKQLIIKNFAESILYHPPKIIPGAKDNIKRLGENYSLAIISDTGFSPGRLLQKLLYNEGILDLFEIFSFSDETGVAKPHEKAFRKALDHFGCEPEEALHIGDIEATDIIGATNAGMKAIRFSGDPTAFHKHEHQTETKAEFDCKTWDEIYEKIEYISKNDR